MTEQLTHTKDMEELNKTINQLDLVGIPRTRYQQAEYIFFSPANGTFTKIDHMLVYKASVNKFKKVKII